MGDWMGERMGHRMGHGMGKMMRWVLLLVLAVACASAAARAAEPERRVALVIGNEAYRRVTKLSNPAHDAEVLAATLRRSGFELVGGKPLTNLDKKGIEQAVRSFGQLLKGGAVGLFYYSGHGVQVAERNYLVPVDAAVDTPADVDFELVNVDLVVKQLTAGGGRLSIIILDACRTNPLAGSGANGASRAAGGGLAAMDAPQGTIISYATAPGKTAADGPSGTNSPYLRALVKAIQEPGLNVLDVFNQVGVTVDQESGGRQQPWLALSPVRGRFMFTPAPALNVASPDIAAAPAPQPVAQLPPAQPTAPPQAQPGLLALAAQLMQRQDPSAPPSPTPQSAQQSTQQLAAVTAPPTNAAALRDLLSRAAKAEDDEDYPKALRLYRAAADQGNAEGQFNVGYFNRKGLGTRQDQQEAVRWYRLAAGQGHVIAQHNLGVMYDDGAGVKQDYGQARHWYSLAAAQGDASSQANLGWLYLNGDGGPKDRAKALFWFKKAAAQGNKSGKQGLAEIEDD